MPSAHGLYQTIAKYRKASWAVKDVGEDRVREEVVVDMMKGSVNRMTEQLFWLKKLKLNISIIVLKGRSDTAKFVLIPAHSMTGLKPECLLLRVLIRSVGVKCEEVEAVFEVI